MKSHLLPILNNKIVDLKTGEVRTRTKEDHCMKVCNVKYTQT